MVSAVELKRCEAGASILGVIVGKFSYWEEPCPIILFEIDKSLEVGFHYTILPLSLAIRLRMEGS